MASNLQAALQAPHSMQRLWSITWGCLALPEMQCTGQIRAQAVQPTHLAGLI